MIARSFECRDCGATFHKPAPVALYCDACSAARHSARKAKVARGATATDRDVDARRDEAASLLERRTDVNSWMPSSMRDTQWSWLARAVVPFSFAFSKNAVWSMAFRGHGHVFMRQRAKDARAAVTAAIAAAMHGVNATPVEAPVHIGLFVQKSNHRGDAINVLDSVCDGIKDALGVDDRWFLVEALHWEVLRKDQRIAILVGQTHTEHHRPCSCCGRVLPMTCYSDNKSVRMGKSRECVECRKAMRRRRRAA